MRNYIKILNFSDFPEIKGLVVESGRMVRTFCSCGFVECSVINKCPSCGNEDFIKNSKTIHGDKMINTPNSSSIDPYSILHFSYGYDIRKTQSSTTSIVKNSRHSYTTLVSQSSMSILKQFIDTDEFKSVNVYMVAKNICDKLNNDEAWKSVCRFCFKLYELYPDEFNEKFAQKFINAIGDKNITNKLDSFNNYICKLTPKELLDVMENLSPITYALCEDPHVFDRVICRGAYAKIDNVPESVQEVLYAYWRGGYILSHHLADVINAICDVGIKDSHAEYVIRFFKEEYAFLHGNMNRTIAFQEYLMKLKDSRVPISNKEFFLDKSTKRIKSAFKKVDIDSLLSDVYSDPTSVFVKLAKFQ